MKHTLFKKAFAALVLTAGLGAGALAAIQADDGNVAEVDGVGYATLQEALSAANNKTGSPTVKLLRNVENVSKRLDIRNSMTLDLNGKTISADPSVTFSPLVSIYTPGDNGVVTIKGDGAIEVSPTNPTGGFSVIAISQGTLNLNGGDIKAETSATTGSATALGIAGPNNGVTVNLNGANLSAKGGTSSLGVNNRWAGASETKFPVFNINSGSITAENENGNVQGVTGNGTVTMNGGTITVKGKNAYGIYFPLGNIYQKVHRINGGIINVTNTVTTSTYDVLFGPAVITGGKFFLYSDGNSNAHAVFSNGNTDRHYAITVSGGFFNRAVDDAYISNESRQVALASGTEYDEGLRYEIQRSKFHVDVTGYNPEAESDGYHAPVAVSASVFKDYSFTVTLPKSGNDVVGADSATLNVSMTGVQTLGLKQDEIRRYSKTVNVDEGDVSASLGTWLSNAYNFSGATCPVTIKADGKAVNFKYNIAATNDYKIVGTADNEDSVRAAWHLMVENHVTSSQDLSKDDAHFLFKKGAYLQIGDERITFLNDFDFAKGAMNLDNLFADAQTRIEKVNVSGASTVKAVAYLPTGSTLGLSSSEAAINQDVYVTMDGSGKATADNAVTGFFTGIKNQEYTKRTAIIFLVQTFNKIIGMVDNADGTSFTVEFKQPKGTPKFHVDVTGYDADDDSKEITVNADVYKDYSFDVSLPDTYNDNLTASKATVNISMTGVQSLGLGADETRSYSKTVNTGVEGFSAKLSGYLKNTYGFKGAECPVTIKADGKTAQFTYRIDAITSDYHIVGTPLTTAGVGGTEGAEAARQAWWLMVQNHVDAAQDLSTNDTHFLFKKGAYLQVGDERLVFLNDFDFLKGTASMENLFDGAQVKVQKVKANGETVSGANSVKAVAYLPAGSSLGVSSSAATVNQDVCVTMDGTAKATDDNAVTGFFTTAKSQATNAKAAIGLLVKYFDQVVGTVSALGKVEFTVEFTKPQTPKFHVDVTGVDANNGNPIAVNADVYSDYSFKVQLPDVDNDGLSASTATVNVSMTGVQSLGLKDGETRSFSKTVNTNVEGVNAKLSNYLENTYKFNGVECPVQIVSGDTVKSFTYSIAGINDEYQIVGTPSSTEDARAAWWFMTSHVTAQKGVTPEDSHFLFKKGSYIQVGNEKLVFTNDFDFLKGGVVGSGASLQDLFKNAEVKKASVNGDHSTLCKVYLPAGSTMGLSSSAATVTKDVTVSMEGAAVADAQTSDNNTVSGVFSEMLNSDNLNAKAAIAGLIRVFDAAIGAVDAAEKVSFKVEFTEAKPVKFHVDVTGYKADDAGAATDTEIKVDADVYNDYSFKVSLPDTYNDNLSASKATVNVSMTGVQSLGLATGETRNYTKTVNTGVNMSAKLSTYLDNTYKFGGVKAPVQIVSGDTVKSFTYNIAGINADYEIVGTPSSTEDARAAWWFMTSHVKAVKDNTKDDAHFLFKKGSYIRVGDEKLVFVKDFDFLKGGMKDGASMKDLFDGAKVEKQTATPANTKLAEVYLPAGSTLGLSSSAATVTSDVTVSMDGAALADNEQVKDLFSAMQNSATTAKAAIGALIKAFDAAIGEVDKVDEVSFKVEFTEPEKPKFHVDVTGVDGTDLTTPIAVDADVYKDYSFVVSLPTPGKDILSASTATVNVSMTGVQSLGLATGETRSFSKTVNTGVEGVKAQLSKYLENTYAFKGVTCPVTIKDAKDIKTFQYVIDGIDDNYQIVGTPYPSSGEENTVAGTDSARAAWWFMTSHVTAQKGITLEDSHFLFKKGSYIQVGNEKLVFTNDFDFLKGGVVGSGASLQDLFSNAEVATVTLDGDNSRICEVYLPAGSTLGLSSSAATVTQDVTVTMDGADVANAQTSDNNTVRGVFSDMLKSDNLNAKTAIAGLIKVFDAAIGAVGSAEKVRFTVEFTQPRVPKFHVDVTGYDPETGNEKAVNADVYGDYSFDVELINPNYDALSASKATLNIRMTGVQTLGLKEGETRSYSKTVDTGVEGASSKLSTWLPNTYKFNGATCPVEIVSGDTVKSFTYNIAGITGDYHIVGTPSDTEDARAAWHFMVGHVDASQDLSVNDTHFLFKKGSYLQVGDEKLVFLADFDFLKGAASMDKLFDGAQVRIEKVNIPADKNSVKATAYLPAGSTLGVSSSAATVTSDVYVTMDGTANATEPVTGFFTTMKDQMSNKVLAIKALLNTFDAVVGQVDQLDNVSFKVEFKQPETKPVKFHVDVTGYKADENNNATDTEIAVNADVYNDYSFKVSLPDTYNDNLSASKATINISMTGVQSLGLATGETRSASKEVNTGVNGVAAQLSKYLENTYVFKGVTCPVTIKDAKDIKTFQYVIDGIDDNYQIVGTPYPSSGESNTVAGTDSARAAWWFMTSHVTAQKGITPEDSHFLFKKGSYIQVGNQKLVFTNDFDFLKGGVLGTGATISDLFANAETEKVEVSGDNEKICEVYLPAGSTLGLSNSAATVTENVTVTMNGAAVAGNEKVKDFFTAMQNKDGNKAAIAALIRAFDAVVGEADKAEKVSFTVEFTQAEVKVNDDTENVTLDTFNLAEGDKSTEKADAFTVSGKNLNDAITLTVLHGAETGFSVEPTSVAPTDGTVSSTAVKVTFSSENAGEYNDTVMVTSTGADTLYVYLSASKAGPVQYKNTANDEWKTMFPDADSTYNINGDNLYAFRVIGAQENVNIKFTRKLTADVWAAWVAPFDMKVTSDLLNDYDFGYLEGVSNGGEEINKEDLSTVIIGTKLLKAGDVVKANLPYIVRAKSSGEKTFTVDNTTLKVTSPVSTTITGNAYLYTSTGIYTTKTASSQDNGWYGLSTKGDFSKMLGNVSIRLKPFRFFLTIDDRVDNPYKSKPMYIKIQELDGMATGINGINNDADGEQKIYDLQGRRVYKPTVKGVYIVNGRKVVLGK